MKKLALTQARWFVLRFLLDARCFSPEGHQVLEGTVVKHVGRSFGDRYRKEVRGAVSQLISSGLVLSKRKHYGLHLWLNRARLDEITQILATPPEAAP